MFNMHEKIFFDTVKTKGDGYLIDYLPAHFSNRAILTLTFLKDLEKEEMARIAELELQNWVEKYPITTHVILIDKFDEIIDVKDFPSYGLIWWIDPKTKQSQQTWEKRDSPEYSIEDFKEVWDKLSIEVGFRTQTQIRENSRKLGKQKHRKYRFLRFSMLIWFFVIPATWIGVQQLGPEWIGWCVTAYASYKLFLNFRKTYFGKYSKKELSEYEKNNKMENYYHHCELNPTGFAKLCSENFANEEKEKIIDEYEKCKKIA